MFPISEGNKSTNTFYVFSGKEAHGGMVVSWQTVGRKHQLSSPAASLLLITSHICCGFLV